MNEGTKTGIFWATAVAMLAVAIVVTWPATNDNDPKSLIGNPLFPGFTDPLTASSLRIVTFNDDQGEIRRFEVAKDESTGVWSLPSRNNYPADAAEQMQKAANALVGLKVLDIQTENAEDHSQLGVIEPKPDSLEIGDAGVGRLVSVRGDKNQSLASVIIGNPVADSPSKRYVRIPGQDPVYVVNLEDTVFSSRFEDWIEKDLLQLSSIDISELAIQNYDAALEGTGAVSLNRSYDAKLAVDGSNAWELLSLVVFDEQQQPQPRLLAEGETLATSKLNALKNALDDLKIADVAAKPKGMSESLKADEELASNNEAVRSLAARGFFPISGGDVISANGELGVTLNDGVKYILRFGNVQGLSDEQPAEGEDAPIGGANRYLLVTAQLDDSKFPPPALKSIPKTIEELDAMEREEAGELAPEAPEEPMTESPAEQPTEPASEPAAPEATPDEPQEPTESEPKTEAEPAEPAEPATPAEPAEPAEPAATEEPAAADSPAEEPSGDEPTTDSPSSDENSDDACGDEPTGDEPVSSDEPAGDEPVSSDEPAAPTGDEPAAPQEPTAPAEPAAPADSPAPSDSPAEPAETPAEPTETPAPADTPAEPATPAPVEETDEEKQERLEAAQERLTKDNQRMLDERKERMDNARRRVRELNNRFAQWYYVIPESTYRNLRISLDDLIESPTSALPPGLDGSGEAPTFNFPGFDLNN